VSGSLPRALLVDLDDTIIDDTGEADRCWDVICCDAAVDLGVAPDVLASNILQVRDWYWSDTARHRVGRLDLRAATAQIVGQALASLGLDAARARPIAEAYRDRRDACQVVLPGAVEMLETLRERGVAMALLTNGATRPQQAKIDRFSLASYFDCIVIEEAFGVGKPDERVYRHALVCLDAKPGAAWMVGDNLEWDVAAPQRLGLRGVWIDVKQRGLPAGSTVRPDRIIAALRELL
jgi:putative hydrolase of the HAD superfamily